MQKKKEFKPGGHIHRFEATEAAKCNVLLIPEPIEMSGDILRIRESEEQKQKRLAVYRKSHRFEVLNYFKNLADTDIPNLFFKPVNTNPMDNKNTCETEKDREIYHLNQQLADEKEWGAQALDMAHKALELAEYVTTQRDALEKSLAEEIRHREYMQRRLDEMTSVAKELGTKRDELVEMTRNQARKIIELDALNKELKAKKKPAKQARKR